METVYLFFSGYNSHESYWDDAGKYKTNLVKNLKKSKNNKIHIIDNTDSNYNGGQDVEEFIHNLHHQLLALYGDQFQLMMTSHSLGGVYGLMYSFLYPKHIKKSILIDIVFPNTQNITAITNDTDLEVKNRANINMALIKMQTEPDKLVRPNIIYAIFHNELNPNIANGVELLEMLTSKNEKSSYKLMNNGHMIHWKRPDWVKLCLTQT